MSDWGSLRAQTNPLHQLKCANAASLTALAKCSLRKHGGALYISELYIWVMVVVVVLGGAVDLPFFDMYSCQPPPTMVEHMECPLFWENWYRKTFFPSR